MRILLLDPWSHGSHARWAAGYQRASQHDVDVISLGGDRWRWLLRGGALPLAERVGQWVRANGQPDLLFVTGMVDVAQLVGLVSRWLDRRPPVAIYQHESQLIYPGRRANEDESPLRNWLSWAASDLVMFNSEFHRSTLLAALPDFLSRQPEPCHIDYLDDVVSRFEVHPVGVELGPFRSGRSDSGSDQATDQAAAAADRDTSGGPVILWPHRWERDKDPEAFVAALTRLETGGRAFRLVLAGEDPPGGPQGESVRDRIAERFAGHVDAVGPFDRSRYVELVRRADIVVSCAHHEFFGMAVVEAMAAGCRPVFPRALSYPELVQPPWREHVLYEPGQFGSALREAVDSFGVESPGSDRSVTSGLAATMDRFDWATVAPRYDERFERLRASAAT